MDPNTEYEALQNDLESKLTLNQTEVSETETLEKELNSKLTLNSPSSKGKEVIFSSESSSKGKFVISSYSSPKGDDEISSSDSSSGDDESSSFHKSKGKSVFSEIEGSSSSSVTEQGEGSSSMPFSSDYIPKEYNKPLVKRPKIPLEVRPVDPDCYLQSIQEKYKDEQFIMLRCEGGEEIMLPIRLVEQSGYVRNMLEVGLQDDVVLVPLLSEHVLMMLVQYWDWHVGEKDWDYDKAMEMDDWENGFFEMIGPDNMFELFIGANYIDARGCLERGADYVADLIRVMKLDEIREHFNIKNDFSPEEEEELKKMYPWAYVDDDEDKKICDGEKKDEEEKKDDDEKKMISEGEAKRW